MEAISHAGTVLGILASDGVVLAAEKKVTSKLLEQDKSSEKIFQLSGNVLAGVAGMTADANSLVNYGRNAAQKYLLSYDDDIPVEQLVQRLCDLKQGYTQFGGLRPFGVSILYAGYDAHHTFQLYQSDPSGNYSGWKATCIGMNNGMATSLLKQEYKEDMDVKQALGLAARVLSKTMDTTSMESDKRTSFTMVHPILTIAVEFAVLKLNDRTKAPQPYILTPAEIDRVLQLNDLAKAPEDGASMKVDA